MINKKHKYIFAASAVAGATAVSLAKRRNDASSVSILVVRPGDERPNLIQVYSADIVLAEVEGKFVAVKGPAGPESVTLIKPERYAESAISFLEKYRKS